MLSEDPPYSKVTGDEGVEEEAGKEEERSSGGAEVRRLAASGRPLIDGAQTGSL